MVNVNKLRGKIVERGLNIEKLAALSGIAIARLNRRLASDGKDFTIEEADAIAKALKLDFNEVNSIFFAQYVA